MARRSDIVTRGTPDTPVVLDATYQIGSRDDRRYLDNQIVGTQQVLSDNLLTGAVCSLYTLSLSSAALTIGMGFCVGPDGSMARASAAALALAGAPAGVSMDAAPPGTQFRGAIFGLLPAAVTGLGAGTAMNVRLNPTTALLERATSPSGSDVLVGVTDAYGNVTLRGSPGAAGAAGASGPSSAIDPVDFIATSNVASLSGTQTIDGVNTASKRGLLQNQTSAAQNGCYFATAGGAWVPDFAADADVESAIGKNVFVKPGGTSVPAEGFNFQLVTGLTADGAKTYARVAATGTRPPVRAVQTAILTSWVYDNGAGTLTAPANGSLGSSWAAMDGVANPATGNTDYEVTGGSLTATTACVQSGLYTLTDGTGGTPAKLTRRTDLDSAADFVGGVAYDVLDGAGPKHKGTRRQLLTQVAVVLGATVLTFSEIRERDLTKTDLTKWPYSVIPTDGYGGVATACDVILNQALHDQSARGGTVRMPEGTLVATAPIFHGRSGSVGATLVGAGMGRTILTCNFVGGALLNMCVVQPPNIGATHVDSLYDQPLEIRDPGGSRWYFDLTEAGLCYAPGTSGFDCRVMFRQKTTGGVSGGHITSVRGAALDTLTVHEMHYLGTDTTNTYVLAKLRTIDLTVLVASGSSPPAVLLSGALVDSDLPVPLVIEITSVAAGTGRGQAQFRYSVDNGYTWEADVTTHEENITIPGGGTYALKGNADGLSLTFPVGVYGTSQAWTNVQTTTLVSITPMGATHNYEIAHTYDGTTTRLYVNQTDGAPVLDPAPRTAAQTGSVWQFPYETGKACAFANNLFGSDAILGGEADGYLGGLRYGGQALSVAAANPTIQNVLNGAAQQVWFGGNSIWATTGPDGVLRHWLGRGPTGSAIYWIPRRVTSTDVKKCKWRDFTLRALPGDYLTLAYAGWTNERCSIQRVSFEGSKANGLNLQGGRVHFYNHGYQDLYFTNAGAFGLKGAPGAFGCHNLLIAGPVIALALANTQIYGTGLWFLDGQGKPFAGAIFSRCSGYIDYLAVSTESTQWAGAGHMTAGIGFTGTTSPPEDFSIRTGFVACQNASPALLYAGNATHQSNLWLGVVIGSSTPPSHQVKVVTNGSDPPPIRALPGFRRDAAALQNKFISRPGMFVGLHGRIAPTALTAAGITSATVLTAADVGSGHDMINCYTIAAGQVAALDALRLSGALESTEFRVTLQGVQANDLLIKDDASGATIDTIAAGTRGTFTYRHNGTEYELI